MLSSRRVLWVAALFAVGCGTPVSMDAGAEVDAGLVADAGVALDAGGTDAGVADAGVADAGSDAGSIDAGDIDAGGVDAGDADAGAIDAGDIDAGELDAGGADAGGADAGGADAGSVDAGGADAGSVDAGGVDAGGVDAGAFDAGPRCLPVDAGAMAFCSGSCVSPAGETCWSCWSARPDAGGRDITITAGERILLDQNIDVGRLTVRGQLTTAPTALTIRARAIDLEGSWVAGTSTTPHTAPLRVTLTGSSFPVGSRDRLIKVLPTGRLELHGVSPFPVFTTLEAADAGATQVAVSSLNNWCAGDEVIVTPSGHHADSVTSFSMPDGGRSRTEWLQLTAANATAVTLNAPLAATRYGIVDAGWPIDFRAQVANLTRNIVIEGEADNTWTTNAIGASIEVTTGSLILDGVRLNRAGYPAFDSAAIKLTGIADGGVLLSNNAITDTNRGVVINFANANVMRDNVIARVAGHGVWLMTGVEQNNVLEHNLVAAVRRPATSNTFNVSESAVPNQYSQFGGFCGSSAFMLGGPANFVRRNVATEVAGCGYWLSFTQKPQGLAASVNLSPAMMALGSFDDNLAHAVLYNGVLMGNSYDVDAVNGAVSVDTIGYAPQLDARITGGASPRTPVPAVFRNTRVLGSQSLALNVAADDLTLSGLVVWNALAFGVSNYRAVLKVEDALVVGRAGPAAHTSFATGPALNLNFGLRAVRRSRFVNTTMWSLYGWEQYGHTRISDFSANEFENVVLGDRVASGSQTPFFADGPILDDQGIGGFPGRWWTNNVPFYTQGNTCAPVPPATSTSGLVCTGNYLGLGEIKVGTGTGTFSSTPTSPDARVRREVSGTPALGYPVLAVGVPQAPLVGLPIPANESVRLEFPTYSFTPRRVSFVSWSDAPGLSAVLKIAYPAGTTFSISSAFQYYTPLNGGPFPFTAAASIAEVAADPAAEKYFFDGTYLYLRVKSDYRGNDARGFYYNVYITATHPSLP